ncbi:MAG: hypothetical protein INQ03_05485 [Candidatus Heimdallarchaeota archaeon]|nr:hypothetical protein [Candidatus Heimdallarchaeota archaeon]
MLTENRIEKLITVCAWCGHEITKNGIRKSRVFEKGDRENYSNGICLVCAVTYFK